MRVGVVDVGTNSVRVLVADVEPQIADIARELTVTRLGEGVDRDRRLGEEPMRRTIETIGGYVARCRELRAVRVRIIATSAVRDAANREEFLARVERATGVRPDVLGGDEEALLGFSGATLGIDDSSERLVVDIGGGSTELVRGTSTPERFLSLDIGSVRMTERHITTDPPEVKELDAVRADADTHVARAAEMLGDADATMIGLAGTITTVAAIALGLHGYDRDAIHHSRLQRGDVASIRERLASMTSAERRELPAMPRGREDVIVAGVVILEAVMDRFAAREILVSESDILDGTALALSVAS